LEKLRKALEKAKRARQQDSETEPAKNLSPNSGNHDQTVRVSPEYCQCQSVELHPEKVAENRCVCLFPEALETESYKVLRTQILQRTRDKGWNTVMITSARPGEGKTVTAINLAFTFAREFLQTVLLVDCDLKSQKIHYYLGLSNGKGISDYLIDDRPMRDLIVWPTIDSLTLISGGTTVQHSAELIGSPKMKALVFEMKNRYRDRYIFFDVPPLLSGADAMTFAPLVDGILMVVETDRTSINDVKKSLELIPQEKFLGFVLNRHKSVDKKAYLQYGNSQT
jgi:non-specific protein-tyrosine kinase